MKWVTYIGYVDLTTGEHLTKEEVKKNYIIKGKNLYYGREHSWKNRIREEIRTKYIIYECTRTGKQISLW